MLGDARGKKRGGKEWGDRASFEHQRVRPRAPIRQSDSVLAPAVADTLILFELYRLVEHSQASLLSRRSLLMIPI